MRLGRITAATAVVTSTLLLATGGIAVAAPSNDTYAGRTVIGSLPFTDTVDTTTATSDADDAALNEQCGAPATDASVWYEYTPSADGAIIVDVADSTGFLGGVIVATGGPGAWTVETCGPDRVGLATSAGQTYAILAFDDGVDGGGNGGTLRISVTEAPAPPSIDVTVDPIASFDPHAGSATVRGTVTCEGEALFSLLQTRLQQQVGRFTIIGFGSANVTCDGVTRPWSIEVFSENGKFSGGKAADATMAVACGVMLCSFDYEERQVHLRR